VGFSQFRRSLPNTPPGRPSTRAREGRAYSFRCSSSVRSSSRSLEAEGPEIPKPLPISAAVQPCEAEVATSLTIAIPLGERLLQSISCGIVEWDDAREFADMDSALELPSRAAEFRSLPVDDTPSEDGAGIGAERDSAGLELERDFPGDDLKGLLEVFSV
jgi:hypothetical protein